jgi:hypothetical protein
MRLSSVKFDLSLKSVKADGSYRLRRLDGSVGAYSRWLSRLISVFICLHPKYRLNPFVHYNRLHAYCFYHF